MRAFVLSGLLLTIALARPAAAAGPPLLLGVSGCAELDEREIRRLVAAELGGLAVDQQGPDVTLVTVRCGGLSVVIRVDDPLSRKTVERAFDTGPMDRRARARWIALAASELVLSSWIELESNPSPRIPPQGPKPAAALRRAAQAAVRRHAPPAAIQGQPGATPARAGARTARGADDESLLQAGPVRPFRAVGIVSMRSFLHGDGALWGGGVRVSEERFSKLSWSVDLLYEAGSLQWRDVRYSVRSGTFGGWLMLYEQSRALTARLGVGLRTGVVASPPEDSDENSGNAVVWGWPLAATSLTFGIGSVALECALEGGYTVMPVGGSAGPTVSGGWISTQIGVGFRR